MFLGMAGTSFITNEGANRSKIGGSGASFGFALGGAVYEGLILYGEFALSGPGRPLTLEGAVPAELDVQEANLVGLGVGAAYYLMPINVYFSATVLASFLSIEGPNSTTFDSSTGPGLSLMLGKEWWVSADWGLGIAAQTWLATMGGGELGSARWKATTGTLAFTATYN